MSSTAKYWDKYAKRTPKSEKKISNLMTDHQTYITYLEA